jgi:hypothetical protein
MLSHLNVLKKYYFCGRLVYTNNKSDSILTTSHAIVLTNLTPNTTYYYVVNSNSTDQRGNSNQSDECSFTTKVKESPAKLEMHVGNVTVKANIIGSGLSARARAIATVLIHDSSNNPVEGAKVEGQWSGNYYSGSDNGTTKSDGRIDFVASEVSGRGNLPFTFTFTFTVDNVTKKKKDGHITNP